ncbi:M3 family metallopeptidase, partial [Streptobacillus notomytis]|uniref:M3 family metallopeptidase n=1 Tax=Streptobacillus notomytis TaxID=1712031 RepID=UPI000AAA247A
MYALIAGLFSYFLIKKSFDERWIDYAENEGKRSGAYSSGTYGTNPFILISWRGTLDNLFTLIHELGHSIHSYYTRNYQPY